eukprot:2974683-Pyramimonas_sp.AAC.7
MDGSRIARPRPRGGRDIRGAVTEGARRVLRKVKETSGAEEKGKANERSAPGASLKIMHRAGASPRRH